MRACVCLCPLTGGCRTGAKSASGKCHISLFKDQEQLFIFALSVCVNLLVCAAVHASVCQRDSHSVCAYEHPTESVL